MQSRIGTGAGTAHHQVPAVPLHQQGLRRRAPCRPAALPGWIKDIFDYESWAPKSSRVWRLQQYQYPEADAEARSTDVPDIQVLNDRISRAQPSSSSSSSSDGGNAALAEPPSNYSSSSSLGGPSSSGSLLDAAKSFSDVEDDELSSALNQRIRQIATTSGSFSDEVEEEEMRQPLTGQELRSLLLSKYGKSYDMSFVKRQVPGMKTFVSLNVMWLHLEQRSFQMTEAQYMEKLDGIATFVNLLGQTDKVRAFMKAPAKASKGLPARPVVGTAVSIRFDLPDAVIQEWFGQGYD